MLSGYNYFSTGRDNAKFQSDLYVYDKPSYSILIDVDSHTLTLLKNGIAFKSYPIAVGKPSTPTPRGHFNIKNTAINPGGPFGVRWFGLNTTTGDYGIHGTNNPSSIGKSVSNGCVRMHNQDVLDLAKYVSIGTNVSII